MYSITLSVKLGEMGPFSLVAHATRLLGQVLRHISSPVLDEEEALLLGNALEALRRVVVIEEELQNLHLMNQQCICSM